MRRLLLLVSVLLVNSILMSGAQAQFAICNNTRLDTTSALGVFTAGNWVARGWWTIAPGQCTTVLGDELANRYYYFYAYRSDGTEWKGESDADSGWFCNQDQAMVDVGNDACAGPLLPYRQIDTGDATDYTLNITYDNEPLPDRPPITSSDPYAVPIATGVLNEQCLFSWESSHQVHSTEVIIELNYQALKTTMKRLDHCLKLTTTGPIDIGDLGQEYLQGCIDYAIYDDATLYLLEGIIALGIDVLSEGATGGGATAAVIAAYITGVGNKAVDCLTDTDRIGAELSDRVKSRFNASIVEESHWVYWDL